MKEEWNDSLEHMTEDHLEEIGNEMADAYTAIKLYLGDYIDNVVTSLFKGSAQLDAKYNKALSYPAHIITAAFTGSMLYIYDRAPIGPIITPHEIKLIKLLCTALTLHDVNKFWNEVTGSNYEGNYYKLLQDYFEIDPFNLKEYFPEWEEELDEIAFLVQHAQESDDAQHETRFLRPKYARLLPYVKIGDKIASLSKMENPLQEILRRLEIEGHDVHVLWLPEMPQQLLSQVVYRSAKELLVNYGGVPLLISPNGILYLSKDVIFTDKNMLKNLIGRELISNTDANPELTDRKFNLLPLLSVPLDKENRFNVYLDSVQKKTESGLLSALSKTIYPEEKDLQEALACISYFVYNDKKGSDWTKFPELERNIQDDQILEELRKIGQIRQNFANQDGVGGQKCKPYTVHEIVQNCNDYKGALKLLHGHVKETILSRLDDDSSALDSITDLVYSYNTERPNGLIANIYPKGNTDVCFMCGAVAKNKYKPGRYFLQSGGFTKRATLNDQYKRECDACQLERLLLNHLIKNSGFRVTDDLIFFYFYFDTIFANLDPFQNQMSKVEICVEGTKTKKLGLNFTLGDFATPFHIEPMAIKSSNDHSSKTTRRARAIHTAINACLECGCKCVVTSPYSLMRMYDDVFYNERPNKLEMNFGLDRVKYFKDARRLSAQLDVINQLDGIKGLHRVQRFEPIMVIPYIKSTKRETKNFSSWVIANGENVKKLFGGNNLNMKEIAEKGVLLFGKHRFSGSYKRVKIFRTSLDSLVASKAQKYSDDEAMRFAAAEVWKDVLREQYSPKKGKDIPAECLDYVESIVMYLRCHDLWDVKKISQWGNSLTDMYEFEYILAIKNSGDEE
ncbi:MAG TPA: hypothetical protein HA349_04620 [Methanotrichaceae archaeon]|nr:hypothetical protein [Methanotrichaceae archaeon]